MSHRRILLILILLAVLPLLLILPADGGASPQDPHRPTPPPPSASKRPGPMPARQWPDLPAKIEPALLKELASGNPRKQHSVIVQMVAEADLSATSRLVPGLDRRTEVISDLRSTARQSQADLLSFLQAEQRAGHVGAVRSFWVFNGLATAADADTLLAVAARPDVAFVREDRWRQWVDPLTEPQDTASTSALNGWNIARVQADQAWDALGLDGAGVTLAIMDTGVDWQHPALQAQYRGYKPEGLTVHEGNWFCTTEEGYLYPVDGHGHGTHVAGTAVGSQDNQGQAIGVAPGAQWIAVKTLDDGGFGYDSWIHAAFEWLMAPAGDPRLAPDVVNGSWGSADMQSEVFRPDIQALVAAGIVPVFAAGNEGPRSLSVRMPANYPEAIAVGATDDLDQVASFSSRGPSPWGEIKPEVAAPGTQIWSSLPGGTFGVLSGTSMASPHVAGLAAILLQADPSLTVDEVEGLLTSTALPLGDQVPNNDTGWGRIDVYQAGAVALRAGYLTGQVTRSPDKEALPGARIVISDRTGEREAVVLTDSTGRYIAALPPGQFDLTAEAFGYERQTVTGVEVESFGTTTIDLTLTPLPAGVLWGQVRDSETGGPVGASISIPDTPVATRSDPTTGLYSLPLPAGSYSVDVAQNGYRRSIAPDVGIVADRDLRLDFNLVPAPTLLLIDSGPWYYGSQVSYFEQALDDRGLVYDSWAVRDPKIDIPTLDTLTSYEITIWSAPLDAPGLIGAGRVISEYLGVGGSLLLTGQDIGYWDGGLSGVTWHPYYARYLKAVPVSDNAGRSDIIGAPQLALEGLQLPINGPDSAKNQLTPDLIDRNDSRAAAFMAHYLEGGGAGLGVKVCQSYRAAYLAAGLEGLGDRSSRAEAMDRIVGWLASPPPLLDAELYPPRQAAVWLHDRYITYTLELLNTGAETDRFTLELSPSKWDTTAWDGDFSTPIAETMDLAPCQTQTLGVRVEVPVDVRWNASDVVTLTARSKSDPSLFMEATFSSKAPAPVLLVDDRRWYDVLDQYRLALDADAVPYDVWAVNSSPYGSSSGPSLERLQRYPVVIWFTAYDWYATLTSTDEEQLSGYLDGGGRLLLSSQDYLYTSGFTPFARDYLGVDGYTEALTATQVFGAAGSPIGDGLDIAHLTYPYRNWSDALHATEQAQPALWGQHAQPVALTLNQAPWKTAFFSFPLETLPERDLAGVISRTVGWLSPLGDSVLSVDRSAAADGEELAYTLLARNTGPALLSQVVVSNTLPAHTSLVPGTLKGPATYDPTVRRLTWAGAIAPGGQVEIRYRLLLDSRLPEGVTIRNIAHLADESGLALNRIAETRVNAPDLSHSTMLASAQTTVPGAPLVYTIHLSNTGTRSAQVKLTDPVPQNTEYQPGSAWASTGTLTDSAELVSWTGTMAPGELVTLEIPVDPAFSSAASYILNRATLSDGWGQSQVLEAYTWVEVRLFFPIVGHR
jgi:uncharacterized repeat protein (TIGR01451 family)